MSVFHHPLIKHVLKHVNLTEQDAKNLLDSMEPHTFQKKELMLRSGDVAHKAAFVLSGCLRNYAIEENGHELVLQFAPTDWWITDNYSFISQKPSKVNIEALETTEVLLLNRDNQMKLFDCAPAFERYFRILTENALVAHQQLVLDNLGLTAQERYVQFCKRYPSLVDKIAQKYIASYIGVTPEFLSKMRAQLLRAK